MSKKLVLLDGMALIYRAHFAFIRSPVLTRDRRNVSALFGFTNTLLEMIERHRPSHIAMALDTSEPTFRHERYPAYKANREESPEDIREAIPDVVRLCEAFRVPVLRSPGYEADDIIGTYARLAESEGFFTYMVTPDKDFAQLVTEQTHLYKPGRQGQAPEIFDPAGIREHWNVEEPARVADILGLWGDSSDNIPGVPGIGEKTSKKLIGQYKSLDNLLAHTDELKGKQRERLEEHAEDAVLSRELATICTEVPVDRALDDLASQPMDEEAVQAMFTEFEFNTLAKRLFGKDFKAGRGGGGKPVQGELFGEADGSAQDQPPAEALATIATTDHDYRLIAGAEARAAFRAELEAQSAFCFDLECDQLDPRGAGVLGIAFSWAAHRGAYVAVERPEDEAAVLAEFAPALAKPDVLKIGHNLKFDLLLLAWKGVEVTGPLFDTMVAHFLIAPERRHNMDALAEQELGYTPVPISELIGDKKSDKSLRDVELQRVADYAAEDADITWQLHERLAPRLEEAGQTQVFHGIEMPLIPALVAMEREGVRVDPGTLQTFGEELQTQIDEQRDRVFELAGEPFNLNSPKQLGEILYERLRLVEKPKRTRTGQYATNEPILRGLAPHHEIVRCILDYREASKLKSTYVDALPLQIHPETGRVHTTFSQFGAATGRLASSDPNLQNIPIRTELGQEIRKAFVPRGPEWTLLAADYSQIELRVMAQMSGDEELRGAFDAGLDIHAATAAKVYGVPLEEVTTDMRRKAKMVNFGIIYGISAFGLQQRLGVTRKEASDIIAAYFREYPAVKRFMDSTVERCRRDGFIETLSGRHRTVRDIDSRNRTLRNAAERVAINSPIQGTAADMIKIAMTQVQQALREGGFRSRMLLQVHDELVFDLFRSEAEEVCPVIEKAMRETIPFEVPIVIEMGVGDNWLEAH